MTVLDEAVILQQLVEYQPLGWTVSEYSTLSSIGGIGGCLTLIVVIIIFKKILKMSDVTMGIAGSLSAVAAAFGYSIATVSWMVYAAMAVGLIRQLSFVCINSIQISLVERSEVGKMMSIVGSIQSISQIISVVMFLQFFNATAPYWPGAVFSFFAFMLVIPLAAFCIVDVTNTPAKY